MLGTPKVAQGYGEGSYILDTTFLGLMWYIMVLIWIHHYVLH